MKIPGFVGTKFRRIIFVEKKLGYLGYGRSWRPDFARTSTRIQVEFLLESFPDVTPDSISVSWEKGKIRGKFWERWARVTAWTSTTWTKNNAEKATRFNTRVSTWKEPSSPKFLRPRATCSPNVRPTTATCPQLLSSIPFLFTLMLLQEPRHNRITFSFYSL